MNRLVVWLALILAIGAVSAVAQQQPNQWYVPGPSYSPTPGWKFAPKLVTAMTDTVACPSARDLVYFYRSGLDFGDRDVIYKWIEAHACAILPKGGRYSFVGAGSAISMITVGAARMYVRADMILGQ